MPEAKYYLLDNAKLAELTMDEFPQYFNGVHGSVVSQDSTSYFIPDRESEVFDKRRVYEELKLLYMPEAS
jgi:hypothetical protein